MEMTYLQRVEAHLDMPSAKKADVMRELEAHFSDIHEELIGSGIDSAKVELEAEHRMGLAEDVAQRLNAAHNTASWRSAILAAAPFMVSVLLFLLLKPSVPQILPVAAVGGVTAVVSIRELVCRRRSVWLATWLATALICGAGVIGYITQLTSGTEIIVPMRAWTLSGIGFSVIVLAAAFSARKLRTYAFALCGIYWLFAFHVISAGPTGSTPLGYVILSYPVLVALAVLAAHVLFECHPYASAANASLFLLTLFVLKMPFVVKPEMWGQIALSLFTATAILCFTRASNRELKTNILMVTATITPLQGLAIHRFLILFPMWMEDRRRKQENRPEIVQ